MRGIPALGFAISGISATAFIRLTISVILSGPAEQFKPTASTPSAWSVGQTLDTEGVGAAYGALLAEECAAFGFNMDFAPSLDIWSNPDNTVIGDRAFGNDWEWTAFFGMSAVEGMEKQGP